MFETLLKYFRIFVHDKIDNIPVDNDLRTDFTKRGYETKCFYCNVSIRVDGHHKDNTSDLKEEHHCEQCVDIYNGQCFDYREDDSQRGNIIECYYCGTYLLVDGTNDPKDDFDSTQPESHCESCMNAAIRNLT